MLDSEIVSAAEQILRAAWKLDLRLTLDWVGPNTVASHIFRVRTHAGDQDIPRTLIIKAANRAFTGDSPEMVFNEWASLAYLQKLDCSPPLAAQFYAARADANLPFIVMEDLGSGEGSPSQALAGSDPEIAEQALLDYALGLGRLHACTAGKAAEFRQLRGALPLVPGRKPLYHDPWSNSSLYSREEINRAIKEYRLVFSELGVRPEPGIVDEIEYVTRWIEEHDSDFLVLCQGDQNSLQHCIRVHDGFRMIDFGVAGFRHALIEGMPHRMTWGCIQRVPRRLFAPFETVYRSALCRGCPKARNDQAFRRAMVAAGGRWTVFHVIWRVPDALKADRPRGAATLRQQVLAWLNAFAELSEEFGYLPSLGKSAYLMQERLKSLWPLETHEIPYHPAFRNVR